MALSTYLRNKILDAIFNATSYAEAANVYISLHDGDPGITGANEITGGSYARQQTSFGAAAAGAIESDAAATYTNMPECKAGGANEQLAYVGVWDAVTAGNFLWGGALTTPKDVNAGDTFTLSTGDIDAALT